MDKEEMLKDSIKYWKKEYKMLEDHYNIALKDYDEAITRIDKAIEYIENDLKSFLYGIEYKTLLKILKGEEE